MWDQGFYKGVNSSSSVMGEPWLAFTDNARYTRGSYHAAETVMENFLLSIGNGLTKYFYYDSRLYVVPGYSAGHTTILEHDDSVRTKGVAYGV